MTKQVHTMLTFSDVQSALKQKSDPAKAKILQRYFKTGKGEYGAGDTFLGITVPEQRKIARRFRAVPLPDVRKLLKSTIHEHRFTALEILVDRYRRGTPVEKEVIVRLYLANRRYVNNWDLVDNSATSILGPALFGKPTTILTTFARSKNVWDRRIAVLTTIYFVRNGSFSDGLRIARMLLRDEHDLIHKAVGWMLREIGDRSLATEERFLNRYVRIIPRTMLRYAIEKFPKKQREKYLTI